jgi:predicted aspartyl protease
MKRREFLAGAAGAALLWEQAANAQQPQFYQSPVAVPKDAVLPITLPITYWNSIPVISGIMASGQPERWAVQTGLNAVCVSKETYSRLQLPATNKAVRVNVLDTALDSTEVTITSLKLGFVTLKDINAALLDVFGILSSRPHPDAPAGWLGTPFLSAFQASFDFPKRGLILESAQANVPKDKGTITVPLSMRDGRPFVQVKAADGKPFWALVDTGTLVSLIPTDAALKAKARPLQVLSVSRGSKQANAALTTLSKLGVGKIERADVRAVFLAADAPQEFDKNFAVLGMDFLQYYKVTFNFAKQKIAFTPPSSETPEDDG